MFAVRVAAALVLASLLRMSDGSAFWAGVIPALLTCGAVLAVGWHLVVAPRRTTSSLGPRHYE
jgi:hypothetical protein